MDTDTTYSDNVVVVVSYQSWTVITIIRHPYDTGRRRLTELLEAVKALQPTINRAVCALENRLDMLDWLRWTFLRTEPDYPTDQVESRRPLSIPRRAPPARLCRAPIVAYRADV